MGFTVLQGDCIEKMQELDTDSVDAVITDPPYGMEEFSKQRGHARATFGRANHVDDGWDKISDFNSIEQEYWQQVCRVLKPKGNLFQFCRFENIGLLVDNAPEDLYYKTCGVWHKKNPIPINMKVRYVNSVEAWIHWVYKGKTGTFNNNGKPVHNYYETSLTGQKEKVHGKHSTQKPLALMNQIIDNLTNPGDTVLDPFAGSGSTLVSAVQKGRNAIGIEQNPEYCEIIESRLDFPDSLF